MPLIDSSIMIEEYITDFGSSVRNLSVKMAQGYAQLLSGEYSPRPADNPCPSNTLFQPRALVATFEDGSRIRFPIGNRDNLVVRARALLGNGAICVDYEGEYWPYVPSTMINNTNYATNPIGGFTNAGEKTTGTFQYTSDILGNLILKFAIESVPAQLVTTAIACLSGINYGAAFCTGVGATKVEARKFRGKGLVSSNSERRQTYSRDIKMSSPNPTNCGASNAPNYYCMSYFGEKIKNLHLLLPSS